MRKLLVIIIVLVIVVIAGLFIWSHIDRNKPKPGEVKDEAMLAGRDGASLPGADEDYYADMDYGITKNPEAVRAELDKYLPGISAAEAVKRVAIGRNNWNVWTAGNDRLWDKLSVASVGNLDLLKTVSNYGKWTRDNRWQYYGLVNEPCFKKNTEPRADRWGLRLDMRVEGADCKADPFEDEKKYPGVAYGARGKGKLALGSYYGYGSGIMGLRLFPNPDFDEAAQAKWDPKRYYDDPSYYNQKGLIKPYRVGMSCGFCHIGPNPSNPPADPENPKFENLNSNPGAQYFWIERIFMFDQDEASFIWQLFHTSRPGALDTSLVSSDQINNPRTMNAIYNLGARLEQGKKWGAEKLATGGSDDNKQFNDYVPANTDLATMYNKSTQTVMTTHVLKDGSDSVGALGALNRVYLNIGLFSEDWLLHFAPLIGAVGSKSITPIRIADCRRSSSYWNSNEAQTINTALFFLATAKPDYLAKAPGGQNYLNDAALIPQGKKVFAERCARCHSTILPPKAYTDFFKPGCIGPNYLKCWNDYWQWTKTEDFKAPMRALVNDPNFLDPAHQFLSAEIRVPVTLLETNACSPLATNALRNSIWDNFSSESYKDLPSVGKYTIHDPYSYQPKEVELPAGGRGYTRPASLVSLWSTAPYLQNNSVGHFEWTGSVTDRMKAFDDGIHQMLWPERRLSNPPGAQFVTKSGKMAPGWIDTTTKTTYLNVAPGYLPKGLSRLSGWLDWLFPNVFHDSGIRIGPIPQGTPVNLLSNLDLEQLDKEIPLFLKLKHDLNSLPANPTDEQAKAAFGPRVPELLSFSKCADFVVNRGHYFGTDFLPASENEPGLTDADKNALIAFLKTF